MKLNQLTTGGDREGITPDFIKNVDTLLLRFVNSKAFWHSDATIFDVEFTYMGDFVIMVSYPARQTWIQDSPFWDKYDFGQAMREDRLIEVANEKRYLEEKIKEMSDIIYNTNKLSM